jgi:hypothetical protein
MIVKTKTGSVYEIDEQNKRVRRMQGVIDPTPRQGKDGEWKEYKTVAVVGQPPAVGFFFDWTGLGNGTLTSPIVELIEDDGTVLHGPLERKVKN